MPPAVLLVDHENCVRTGEPVCAQLAWIREGADGRPRVGDARVVPCWGPAPGRADARAELGDLLRDALRDPGVVIANQRLPYDCERLSRHLGLRAEFRGALAAGRGRSTDIRQRLDDIARPAVIRRGQFGGEPQKWVHHALLGQRVRIDDLESSNPRARVNLAELVGRLLGEDIEADKADPASPRLRFGELLGVPVEEWEEVVPGALRYALADPPLAGRVLLHQAEPFDYGVVPSPRPRRWWGAYADEPAQIRGAIGFEAMSSRGMAVDLGYVRERRGELRRAGEAARDRMIEGGTMRDELRWKKRPPAGADPQTRKLTKDSKEIARRVAAALEARGLPVRRTPPSAKFPQGQVSADAEAIFDAVGPARQAVEVDGPDGIFRATLPAADARAALAESPGQPPGTAAGRGWLAPGPGAPLGLRAADGVRAVREVPPEPGSPEADLADLLDPKLLRTLRGWIDAAAAANPGDAPAAEEALRRRLGAAVGAADDPGLAALAVHNKCTKFDSDFLAALDVPAGDERDPAGHEGLRAAGRGVVRPGFSYVLDTGRASGFGPVRQNMPKDGGVRECFVPRPGYALAIVDFAGIELVAAAYAYNCILAGRPSWERGKDRECALSRAINEGMDCHTLLASEDLCDPPIGYAEGMRRKAAKDPEFAVIRDHAKAANFGFWGGMGPTKFVVAKRKEGLSFTVERATYMRDRWRKRWAAKAYMDFAGRATAAGWGWQRQLWSGRIRAGLIFTQFANGWFQALVGDGAKLACWRIWRACYCEADGALEADPAVDGRLAGCHPLHFIHDEFIAEVPDPGGGVAERHLEALGDIMVAAMSAVMPGMKVQTEGKLCRVRWAKR
jgi:hypothetical protein